MILTIFAQNIICAICIQKLIDVLNRVFDRLIILLTDFCSTKLSTNIYIYIYILNHRRGISNGVPNTEVQCIQKPKVRRATKT